VGEWNTNSDIDCGEEFCGMPVQDIPLSYVIVHPSYDKQTYRNNIALLVLKDRINYTGQYEGGKPETHANLAVGIFNLSRFTTQIDRLLFY
jgi:hypothetical protein